MHAYSFTFVQVGINVHPKAGPMSKSISLIVTELESRLSEILTGSDILSECQSAIHIVQDYIRRFEEARPDFTGDVNAEIDFYKNLSPRLFSHLIYYIRIYRLESALPDGSRHGKRKLLKKERKEVERYFLDNESAYRYYKSRDSGLDEELFLRKEHLLPLYIDESTGLADQNLCTPTGLRFARFMAYEKLQEYLADADSKYMPASSKPAPKFTWTSNKVDLVELTYALCYSRAVNNGKLEVKELAQFFASTFDIDLSNIYRSKNEIYTRRNTTVFLDYLKKKFKEGMDESDDQNNY